VTDYLLKELRRVPEEQEPEEQEVFFYVDTMMRPQSYVARAGGDTGVAALESGEAEVYWGTEQDLMQTGGPVAVSETSVPGERGWSGAWGRGEKRGVAESHLKRALDSPPMVSELTQASKMMISAEVAQRTEIRQAEQNTAAGTFSQTWEGRRNAAVLEHKMEQLKGMTQYGREIRSIRVLTQEESVDKAQGGVLQTARRVDREFQRDARRYDGGFSLR